ncbi:BZ3500_MvSof-1268-A1-R1_Chr7-3g09567 [Microbotryum saponariae]|uniref:BZ3500_MvSof-1268-A1-R1_Chr7-3g09567 protein n=1 Tax=Microbotryum saponariae TaxID=289078 RepID=A0A2X0NA48_9BASI|nr:BZ3501_MvSof-1269-A2-R1_Chr7-2g09290 [Microbotryum saponariae]SDA02216.1 BZ3500_MvSof-1268-A1-R1_Chr7-3g09567 [Microbotryum saponariae]
MQHDKDLYSKCLNAFDVSGGSRPDEESTDYDDRPSRTDRLSDEPGLLKFYKSEWFTFWEESQVKDTDHLIRDFALTESGGPVPKTAESRKRAKPKTRVADIDTGDDDDALVDKQDEAADGANHEDERRRKARKADARAKVDPVCPGSLEPKTLPDAIPSSLTSQPTSSTADHADGLNTFLKTLTEIETGRFENEKEAAKHARVEAKAKVKGNLFSMIKLWEERHMSYQASGDWDRAEKAKERLARLNDQLFDKEDGSAEE